jgi:hypothetical protein
MDLATATLKQLRRLLAIDRYERRARTPRRSPERTSDASPPAKEGIK